jgi:diguanylate cyclase (GGDEF)-like protein
MVGEGDKGYVLVSHDAPEVRDLQIDLGKYPEIREVIRTRAPISLDDVKKHPLMKEVGDLIKDLDYTSVMVVPVTFKEYTLGTLFLRVRRRNRGFTPKEMEFCQIVANASYHAFKNAKLFEQISNEKEDLRHLAITDQLTTLFNHSFFYIRLEEEFARAVRYDSPLSLILMDIDDFKRINDSYGHRSGDMVLRRVADVIKNSVRKIDVVARYGGEEIAVLLPQTSLSGAVGEAERIRLSIESMQFKEAFEEVITVSLGVVSYSPDETKRPEDLVNRADMALYEAKSAGKNCVKVAGKDKTPA